MNPYQFLRQLAGLPTGQSGTAGGGDGVRHEIQMNPPGDFRTAAGLVLDGTTTSPKVVAVETNALVIQAAASSNVLGSFIFSVPKDYDPVKDELTLRVTANSAGTTDVPTLSCTAYRKRAGAALTAALTVVASAAVPNNTAKAAERTITLSGNGLLPDDIITVNLTTGAHTTDAINLYGCDIVYRSNIVFSDMGTR